MSLPIVFDSEKMNQLHKTCTYLAGSNLVPSQLRGKPNDILLIMAMAHELDVPMMQAIQTISVIQGKPTISPQMMLGLIYSQVKTAQIKYDIDESKKIVKCSARRTRDDDFYTSTWDMDKARAMGLASKDNYLKQAVTMLKWRATAEACRTVFPDVIMGLYMTEELQDLEGKELKQIDGTVTNADIDKDFPIPEEEKTIGFLYRVQNGKFKGKQLKDIDVIELDDYLQKLKKRDAKGLKSWENEQITVFSNFLENFNTYQDAYMESQDEEV